VVTEQVADLAKEAIEDAPGLREFQCFSMVIDHEK
jgi:hypothetical protein